MYSEFQYIKIKTTFFWRFLRGYYLLSNVRQVVWVLIQNNSYSCHPTNLYRTENNCIQSSVWCIMHQSMWCSRGADPGILTEQNITVRSPRPGQRIHVRIPGVKKHIFYHYYSNCQNSHWVREEDADRNPLPGEGLPVRCPRVAPPLQPGTSY